MAPIAILDQYYLGISVLICLGWQFLFFVGASITRSDKVTDFAYGTNFMGLAAILFACSQTFSARNILVFVFVAVWGLRLALYLFARVIKEGKDARFDGTRDHFFKFLGFWLAQFATVFAISVPFVLLFSRPIAPALQWQVGGREFCFILFVYLLPPPLGRGWHCAVVAGVHHRDGGGPAKVCL